MSTDLQLHVPTQFEMQCRARWEAAQHHHRNVRNSIQDDEMSKHVRQAKLAPKVVLDLFPALDHVDQQLRPLLENSSTELHSFDNTVAVSVKQIVSSRQMIIEVAHNFQIMFQRIKTNYGDMQGTVKWKPETYKSDIKALRKSVTKLEEKSDELRKLEADAAASVLPHLVQQALMGNLYLKEKELANVKELENKEEEVRNMYMDLQKREAEIKVLEVEETAVQLSVALKEKHKKGLEHTHDLYDQKCSTLTEADGKIDDGLRSKMQDVQSKIEERFSRMSDELEKGHEETEGAIKACDKTYALQKKILYQSVVPDPNQQKGCHFIFCLDCSESMSVQNCNAQVRDALKSFYDERVQQHQDDIVTMINFGEKTQCLYAGQPLLKASFDLDDRCLGGVAAYCPVWESVAQFATDFKDPKRKTMVVFMTGDAAVDTSDAVCIAKSLSDQLEDHGGLTSFFFSWDSVESLMELVQAGNQGERTFQRNGMRYSLAVDAKTNTANETFRSIACCMSARDDQVKHKLAELEEQRSKREEELKDKFRESTSRQSAMSKETERLQSSFTDERTQGAARQRALLQKILKETQIQQKDVRLEIEEVNTDLQKTKKNHGALATELASKKEALRHKKEFHNALLESKGDLVKVVQQALKQSVAAQKKLLDSFGGCDVKKLDRAIQHYCQIRKNHALIVEKQYKALDSVASYVTRIADDMEIPLSNEFSEGSVPHLVLRNLKKLENLPVTGLAANSAGDLRVIVQHVADQTQGFDELKAVAVEMVTNAYDLKELVAKPDRKSKDAMETKLINRFGGKYKAVSRAQEQTRKAVNLEKRAVEKYEDAEDKVSEANGDAREKLEVKRDRLEEDLDTKKDATQEAKDRLAEELSNIPEYDATKVLLEKVMNTFATIVDKETKDKEMKEVHSVLQSFTGLFTGPIKGYVESGESMEKEFKELVDKPSLEKLEAISGSVPGFEVAQNTFLAALRDASDAGSEASFEAEDRASVSQSAPMIAYEPAGKATPLAPVEVEDDAGQKGAPKDADDQVSQTPTKGGTTKDVSADLARSAEEQGSEAAATTSVTPPPRTSLLELEASNRQDLSPEDLEWKKKRASLRAEAKQRTVNLDGDKDVKGDQCATVDKENSAGMHQVA